MKQDAGDLKSLERLEVIRKLNGESREWVNYDLYRLMFSVTCTLLPTSVSSPSQGK